MDFTQGYIEELERKVERLERHNAIYNPEYDPARDAPLDAAWEEGNRAAWREVGRVAGERLWGEENNKGLFRMSALLDGVRLELRELWTEVFEEPFPDDLHLADVVKRIRRGVRNEEERDGQ